MKKYIAFVFILSLLVASSVSQPTFANTHVVTGECLNLTTILRIGNRDVIHVDPLARFRPGNIYVLQQFLRSQGYLYAQPTGYFGTATRRALISFQRANGLTQTGTTNLLTRNKIKSMTCGGVTNNNLPIRIISPVGGEQVVLGGNIQVTIENAAYIAPSNATGGYGMYYVVDLVNTYGVIQNLGVIHINTPYPRQTASYQISGSLPVGSDYRILITPSCFTSTAEPRCQVVSSNTFSIGRTTTGTGVTITSPNGGETISAGTLFRLQGSMPSDKRYSADFYLIPQPGTTLRPLVSTYYNSTVGGYAIGGASFDSIRSELGTDIIIPSDIPAGSYKLRVFLFPLNTGITNPTPSNTPLYDDSNSSFTITNSTTNNALRVITPNGGERLEINKEYKIEWASPNLSSSERVNITLEKEPYICPVGYYCTAEAAPVYTIATNVLNQGYYNWNINASTLSQTYGRPFDIGKYKIRITAVNSNATDISDNFFDIIPATNNNPVSVDIFSPQTGEYWPLYTTQRLRFSLANMPSGAVAVIGLKNSSGSMGVLKTAPVSAIGVMDVYLEQITIGGDAIDTLRPGQYMVTLDIYDRTPCLGFCGPDYIPAQKIATDSTGYITIY